MNRAAAAIRAVLRRVGASRGGRRVLDRVVRETEMATRPVPVAAVPISARAAGDRVRLNRLCDLDAWSDPEWMAYNRALGLDGRFHRKDFEWTQCIYGLEALGALGPRATVLDVAAGNESILFYLANRCGLTVATDLYEGAFSGWEAAPNFLDDPSAYAPFPYARDRLTAMRADARGLPFEPATFDVAISLSSIEHFGGHHAAAQGMREIARVLKTGGIACIATEWILEGGDHFDWFTPAEFHRFVVEESGLELVEPIDQTPPSRALIDDPFFEHDDNQRLPHIVLGENDVRWTSVVAFLRKRAS